MDAVKISKRLSLALRHDPAKFGLVLDARGWVAIEALLAGWARRGHRLTRAMLDRIVAGNDKQRFEISADGTRIRARQGHSVAVDLGLAPSAPPATLYHGTIAAAIDAILREGLKRGRRHHVHLSRDTATAAKVGARRGKPVILEIDAGAMSEDGHAFFLTGNNVWLTEAVPPRYIRVPGPS